MYIGLHVKYRLLSDFDEFSRQIFENTQISTLKKIPLKEAEFFRTDGRT